MPPTNPKLSKTHLSLAPMSAFSSKTGLVSVLVMKPSEPHQESTEEFFSCLDIYSMKELNEHLELSDLRSRLSIYILPQESTWDGLDVSWDMTASIIHAHSIGHEIDDIFQAFESRVYDIQQLRWSSCKTYTTHQNNSGSGYNLCYRIQYPIANHRKHVDPYSIRQTGVYQKHYGSGIPDVWILIRPTASARQQLNEALKSPIWFKGPQRDPMYLHLIFLSSLGSQWDEYIEYLRNQLNKYTELVCFARVGRPCKYPKADFQVSFKDAQELQSFQCKMKRLGSVLEANMDVVETCYDRWQCSSGEFEDTKFVKLEVKNIRRQLSFYQSRVKGLAELAQETAQLLNRILDYRHGESVQRTSREVQVSLNALGECNRQSLNELNNLATQTRALAALQQTREKDSKTVKALTAISTLYLPASLVATIFSSDLVQLLPTGSPSQPVHFVPAPQSWIPVLVAILLVGLTFVGIQILERVYLAASREMRAKSSMDSHC